ncbi:MAG: DNA-processing protein DprA [Chloroflexi bacterium]|nr:DNA-processing protein DprA [Chloroflexota bacterium]
MSTDSPFLTLQRDAPDYPERLADYLGEDAPAAVGVWGDADLQVRRPWLVLLCSVRCPGQLILRAHDLAQALMRAATPVVGGFHSPVERECLTVLLRGNGLLVVCPARSLEGMRLPAAWREPLETGRLLLLSPFTGNQRRPDADMAAYRNRCVAALADVVFIVYAAPGSKTEALCREVVSWGKPVFTFDSPHNEHLMAAGARAATTEYLMEELVRRQGRGE